MVTVHIRSYGMRCVLESPHKNRSTSCVCVCMCVVLHGGILLYCCKRTTHKQPPPLSCRLWYHLSTIINSRVVSGRSCSARADVAPVENSLNWYSHTWHVLLGWMATVRHQGCSAMWLRKRFLGRSSVHQCCAFFSLLNSGNAQSPLSPHHPVDGVSPQTAELRLRLPLHQEPRAAGLHLRWRRNSVSM